MVKSDKEKYSEFLNTSISYLKKGGFENIKANIEGYEKPKSYTKVGSDFSITPDIVADKQGRTHIFEIGLKSSEPQALKTKWLFLNTISNMKSHSFKLITTRGHYKFTNEMLEDINLNESKLLKI